MSTDAAAAAAAAAATATAVAAVAASMLWPCSLVGELSPLPLLPPLPPREQSCSPVNTLFYNLYMIASRLNAVFFHSSLTLVNSTWLARKQQPL